MIKELLSVGWTIIAFIFFVYFAIASIFYLVSISYYFYLFAKNKENFKPNKVKKGYNLIINILMFKTPNNDNSLPEQVFNQKIFVFRLTAIIIWSFIFCWALLFISYQFIK
jgi:hypothetical protein